MLRVIVGRDDELASVRDFVTSIVDGANALVLEGEAGAGKTTLWRFAVDHGRAEAMPVLEAQPAQSETALSFSGIADLLEPALADVLDELPSPQRRALGIALLLEDVEGPPPDQRAVGSAVLGALQALSRAGPLLVAVDDVQWLDRASRSALVYAVRRLRDEPVGVVLVCRKAEGREIIGELSRSLPQQRFQRLDVGPLDLQATHRVVSQHLGVALPQPLLTRIHEISGGNPFYALELSRSIAHIAFVEPAAPLPVPETLRELVRGRIEELPAPSGDFLLVVAALAAPTISLVETATGIGREDGLGPALEAHVVEIESDRLRFSHPLLAAAAYDAAEPLRRRQVHERLAEVVDDPEERARHLALAADAPDESVASALEEAARHARLRGATAAAAELFERAARLTLPSDETRRWRRTVDAGTCRFESGDGRRAQTLFEDVIGSAPRGPDRALALERLARVRSYDEQVAAIDLFVQAIAEADRDRIVLSRAHEGVAVGLFRLRERFEEAVDHAARAADLADELGDEGLAAEALGSKLLAEVSLGRESAAETFAADTRATAGGRGRACARATALSGGRILVVDGRSPPSA